MSTECGVHKQQIMARPGWPGEERHLGACRWPLASPAHCVSPAHLLLLEGAALVPTVPTTSSLPAGCLLPRGAHAAGHRVLGGRQPHPQPAGGQGHVVAPRQEGEQRAAGAWRLGFWEWHCLPLKHSFQPCSNVRVEGVPELVQREAAVLYSPAARVPGRAMPAPPRPSSQPQPQLLLLGPQIALDVARALVYLHSRRIVHMDVKSANVLLTRWVGRVGGLGRCMSTFEQGRLRQPPATVCNPASLTITLRCLRLLPQRRHRQAGRRGLVQDHGGGLRVRSGWHAGLVSPACTA